MCPPEEEEHNGSTPKNQNRVGAGDPVKPRRKKLTKLLRRALPFLQDEADKYEDDGSNEPLELIRDIKALIGG